jgi:hypothetical protein
MVTMALVPALRTLIVLRRKVGAEVNRCYRRAEARARPLAETSTRSSTSAVVVEEVVELDQALGERLAIPVLRWKCSTKPVSAKC